MKNLLIATSFVLAGALAAQAGDLERSRGIKVGQKLTLNPYVSLSYTYDSNPDSYRKADAGSNWEVQPGLNFIYADDNWSLVGGAWYSYHAYNKYPDQQNSSSYGERLNFKWADSLPNEQGWSLLISESFQQVAEDDDMTYSGGRGLGRDRKQLTFDGTLERRITERFHAAPTVGYYLLDYENDTRKYGNLYGWKRLTVGGEAGYMLSRWTDFIVNANYMWYDQDNSGYIYGNRVKSDSSGYSLMAGVSTRATERISYRILAGWSRFDYGDAQEINGWTYELSAKWDISQTWSMMALGSSYYQPSESEAGSAVKVYNLSWGLAKSLVRNSLRATLDVAYRKERRVYSYINDAMGNYDEDILSGRFGLVYTLNRYMDVYGRLEYQMYDTSRGGYAGDSTYDFNRFRGTIGLRLTY
ncbi:MAG TPA: hypothetical protein DD637_04600 [Verrucomicrobia bacterium]|nr:hypothetical protein [Verrucomicrobiota bacterium]HCG20762.1 hypothetical protein [Verrucomicrobiota bacterium]